MLAALLIGWGVNVVALLVVDSIFEGVEIGLWGSVLIGAAVLGIANAIVKPILTLLALPLILLTLGLAYFGINVLMLAIAEWVAPDFSIDGFWTYIGATIVVWLVNWILSSALATLFGGREHAASSSSRRRPPERPRPTDRRGGRARPQRRRRPPEGIAVDGRGGRGVRLGRRPRPARRRAVAEEGRPGRADHDDAGARRASRRGSCRRSRTRASCWTRRASSPSRSRPPAA